MAHDLQPHRHRHDLVDAPSAPDGADEPVDPPLFVVQQHDATAMHFDVRLEADGVLVSWAVPKGPSTDPRDKRLAVKVGDHDLAHATFEGRIGGGRDDGEDTYGAGGVIVWDIGPYRNLTTDDDGRAIDVATAVERGHVKVWLVGDKLAGAWAFTHARLGGDDANWLLVKVDDAGADARRNPVSTEPESVLSGRTVQDVMEGR